MCSGGENIKIDAVYTWVGNDAGTKEAFEALAGEISADSESRMKRRITDNGELRYSLRSLRKYASWIEKIHIITNGHPPSWLDLSHSAINHVVHEEIFPDTSVLPTFNSHAIECNLHRIPSLNPYFLYFNDDIFLGRSTEVSTFIRDHELRFYAMENESKKIKEEVLPYGSELYFFISLSEKHWIKRITEFIRLLKNKPLFFCINDDIDHHVSFRAKWLFLLMKFTLQRLFPEPAPWEKDQYTL